MKAAQVAQFKRSLMTTSAKAIMYFSIYINVSSAKMKDKDRDVFTLLKVYKSTSIVTSLFSGGFTVESKLKDTQQSCKDG